MKGFWETWLHVGTGLLVVSVVAGVLYMIYDNGYCAGRRDGGYFREGREWTNKASKN